MVNFAATTPEQKPLLAFPPKKFKPIHKSAKKSPRSKVPLAIEALSCETKLLESSLNSSFSDSSLTSKQLNQSLPNNLLNILQPFCNYSLFPNLLQKLVSSSNKLEQNDVLQIIYQLKTPNNSINFQKKIEKMKLLALGQETILQNYIKDKYVTSQNPHLLKDYYKYMRTKLNLMKDLQEIKNRGANGEIQHNPFAPSDDRLHEEHYCSVLPPNLRFHGDGSHIHNAFNANSLLYDNYIETKHEYFT